MKLLYRPGMWQSSSLCQTVVEESYETSLQAWDVAKFFSVSNAKTTINIIKHVKSINRFTYPKWDDNVCCCSCVFI